MSTIYEQIYKRIDKIIGGLDKLKDIESEVILKSEGFMDLFIQNIAKDRISMTHYYKAGGDLVPDPDMEIKIYPEEKMAEALTYKDTYIYKVAYPEPGKVNPKAKKEMNTFLLQWLKNIKAQKFQVVEYKKGG